MEDALARRRGREGLRTSSRDAARDGAARRRDLHQPVPDGLRASSAACCRSGCGALERAIELNGRAVGREPARVPVGPPRRPRPRRGGGRGAPGLREEVAGRPEPRRWSSAGSRSWSTTRTRACRALPRARGADRGARARVAPRASARPRGRALLLQAARLQGRVRDRAALQRRPFRASSRRVRGRLPAPAAPRAAVRSRDRLSRPARPRHRPREEVADRGRWFFAALRSWRSSSSCAAARSTSFGMTAAPPRGAGARREYEAILEELPDGLDERQPRPRRPDRSLPEHIRGYDT